MKKKQVVPIVLSLLIFSTPLMMVSPPEPVAQAASDRPPDDRDPQVRASRSNTNMFVSLVTAPPTTTTTSTTTTTTTAPRPTTTTTTTPKRSKPATAVKEATEALPASTGGNQDVVSIAKAQVGKRYVSGAEGPNAFDCSGLVYYVFNHAGISIPRLSSDGYYAKYRHVSRGELQPGDLVVYPGHIAIYVGNGNIVSASTPRGGVKHYGMNSPGRIKGYARISE